MNRAYLKFDLNGVLPITKIGDLVLRVFGKGLENA